MGTEATGGRPGGRRRRSLKERQVLEGEVVDLDHDGRGVVRTGLGSESPTKEATLGVAVRVDA